jgi:hypothetical protein
MLGWLPEPNTLLGFFVYSLLGYLFVLLLGWLFNSDFDTLTDYRRKRVENRERARAAESKKKE